MEDRVYPAGELSEEDIPRLLLLSKRELNKEIRAELRKRRGLTGIWDAYIDLKHKVLKFPGKSTARLIKWINRHSYHTTYRNFPHFGIQVPWR